MPHAYDQGKSALDDLIEWAEANSADGQRNEATTRHHLVDQLIEHVLQWPRSQINSETPAGSGRIDYALGIPQIRMIIEAKREGIYFELPAGTQVGVHSIASLVDGPPGRALREALEQVLTYAARHGVGPAGITNGHQLVLFIAARGDGIAPLQGKALVYPSLADMRSDFRRLWDHASPAGVDARNLHQTLRATDVAPPEPLSTHIVHYPGVKRRNNLQAGLEILGELFLEDVARLEELRVEFLRDCYATSGALSQYAEVSKQILQTRYALLRHEDGPDVASAQERRGLSPALTQDMLAAAASRRPIVLLGDVGVGKTTFIQRLVHVDADKIFKEAFTFYIDFGSSTTLGELEIFVIEESVRQLRQRHGIDLEDANFVDAVYNGELNRFDRSVIGRLREIDPLAYERERIDFLKRRIENRAEHVKACLEHLRATHRRQIVIFLDNIDQRRDEDQEQVFLIANELAQTWPGTVFVTLRPETFYRSSRSGALSGYQARVFTISPPRTDVMLERRLDFALKQLKDTKRLGSFPVGITVDSDSLVSFLEMLADNVTKNRGLITLIDNVAGGNMRMALRFVTDFIGSGHIDTGKILEIYQTSGRYTIPLHEFLRALLFGDGTYYEPEASPIANLFRITQADGREHFLLPLLLGHVQSVGERIGEEGYVLVDDVYQFAHGLGFNGGQISAALHHGVLKRLLDASPRNSADSLRLHYRITTDGAYTARSLLTYFAYVDAVLIDTPIVDPEYRTLVQDVHSLRDRVSRCEYFRLYLDKQWGHIDGNGLPWQWPEISSRLADDIHRVGRRADPDTWGRAE